MNIKNISLFFVTILISFFILSCNIGLGEAVDTQVPRLSIETPPVDAIIRDNFAIGGTWNDDGELDSVEIILKRTDEKDALLRVSSGPKIELKSSAVTTSRGKGTWSCLVEPKSINSLYSLKDGKYEIQATVYDKAGHSTKETRLITIDNTKPIIVLDRPSAKEGDLNSIDAYGQKLSILGRAADDNNVDSININLYREGIDTPITVTKNNVSNTIDEIIAVYGDDNYNKIYGSDKNGTVKYNCVIEAFDKSRKYPTEYPVVNIPTGNDLLGNMTNHYYLFSELQADVLEKYKLTVTDLYKMLSGNYNFDSRASSIIGSDTMNELLKLLEKKEVSKGSFTLNPQNNPLYSISGIPSIQSQQEYLINEASCTIQSGARLSIDITPGIDGYHLRKPFNTQASDDEDNYVIKLYPCSENSIDIDPKAKIEQLDSNKESSKYIYIIDPQEVKFTGGSYKILVTIPNYIPFDKYIFSIEGKDILGNDLMVNGGINKKYVLNYVPLDIPPVLNVDQTKLYCNENDMLEITGVVSSASSVPSLSFTLGKTVKSVTIKDKDKNKADWLVEKANTPNLYEYKCTLNLSDIKNNIITIDNQSVKEDILNSDGDKIVTITAESKNNLKTTKEISFTYDTKSPLATIEVVDSLKVLNKNWYKTEQIKVKVSEIKEEGSGIEKIEAGIGNDNYVMLTPRVNKESSGTESIYYNGYVTALNANGSNEIKFRLTDKAGNVKEESLIVFVDTTAPKSIHLISVDDEYKNGSSKQAKFSGTKLVNGKNDVKVVISASDNDEGSGIKHVILKKIINKTFEDKVISAKSEDGKYVLNISKDYISSSSTAGSGTVELEIEDKVGNKTVFNAFTINIDTVMPSTKINTILDADPSTHEIDVNKRFIISGTSSDNNGVKEIRLQYSENDISNSSTWKDYASPITKSETDSLSSWSYEIDTEKKDGNNLIFKDKTPYYFRALAIDEAGNTNSCSVDNIPVTALYINQDSDKPIITLTNITISDNSEIKPANLRNSSTLYGTVYDDDGNINKIEYCNEGNIWKEIINISGNSWNIQDLKEGQQKLLFRVTESNSNNVKHSDSVILKDSVNSIIPTGSLELRVDTKNPEKSNVQYSVFGDVENKEYKTFTDYEESVKLGQKYNDFNSKAPTVLGGIHNKLQVRLDVYDANGIKNITTVLKCKDDNGSTTLPSSNISIIQSEKTSNTPDNWENWTIELSKLDTLVSGNYELSYVITDNSDLTNISTLQLTIDNTPPIVTFTGPDSNTSSSGIITVYGTVDSNSKLYYAVESHSDFSSIINSSYKPNYQLIKDASLSWFVYFDGDETTYNSTHSSTMATHLTKIYNITEQDIKDNKYTDFTSVNFTMFAVDELGNVSKYYNNSKDNKAKLPHKIVIDPQGDRPIVTISSPTPESTVGGAVRFYGTAIDLIGSKAETIGVKSMWMQIISDKSRNGKYYRNNNNKPASFDLTVQDLKVMKDSCGKLYDMTTGRDFIGDISTITNPNNYALKIENFKGSSWNHVINNSVGNKPGPFDPESGATNAVGVRIFAQDLDGKLSRNNDCLVLFDADKPIISDLYLKSKDGNKIIEYSEDMYVSGDWTINGTVIDKDKVSSIQINNNNIQFTKEDDGKTAKFSYDLNIVGDVGKKELIIEATDGTASSDGKHNTQTKTLIINYDNKVPVLAPDNDQYFNFGNKVKNDVDSKTYYEVKQFNSFFTFGSKVTEESIGMYNQSGLAYVASYFVKDGNIINPLLTYTDSTRITKAENKEDGLYWINCETSQDPSSDDVFILKSSTINKNIHENSLVKVNGSYYLIKDIGSDGKTITLNGKPKRNNTNDVQLKIANALIIDNLVQETGGTENIKDDGYFASPTNDDGDRMVEYVKKEGANYYWETNICSRNIPDGPIEIHYVVFDKAGNFSEGIINNAYVKNNSPRIAGVQIKTDYNGNGRFEDNELIKTYSVDNGKFRDYYTSESGNTKFFNWDQKVIGRGSKNPLPTKLVLGKEKDKITPLSTLKDMTVIIPEIVGGNGAIYYSYDIQNKDKLFKLTDVSKKDSLKIIDLGSLDYSVKTGNINIQLGDLIKIGDGKNIPFNFRMWDSTEGTIPYKNSQYVDLEMYFNVSTQEVSEPTVSFIPLSYDSSNGTINGIYNNDKKNGHVDIINNDVTVSGKIEISGTAFDEKQISQLELQIPGMNNVNSYTKVAFYDLNQNKTIIVDAFTTGKLQNDGIEFIITKEEGPNEKGHKIEWKLVWDTEKLPSVTKKSQEINIKIINKGVPSVPSENGTLVSIDGTTKYTSASYSSKSKDAKYTVDVVPYITKIERNSKEYNTFRAKSGAIPLRREDELNKITGFNIGKSGVKVFLSSDNKGQSNIVDCENVNNTGTSVLTFKMPKDAKNGYLQLSVNDGQNNILAINNINDNTRDYNKEYNKDAYYHGEDNNSQLNKVSDDRIVKVWRVSSDDKFNGTDNTISPAMSKNPSTKVLYASYANTSDSSTYYTEGLQKDTHPTKVYSMFDPTEYTDIIVTDNNVNVFYAANYNNGASFSWEGTYYGLAGGLYIYSNNAPNLRYPIIDKYGYQNGYADTYYQIYRGELYTYDNVLGQFKNIRIARNDKYIYTIYFDKLTNSIKFSSVNDNESIQTGEKALPWINIDGNYDELDNGTYEKYYDSVTRQYKYGIKYKGELFDFVGNTDSDKTHIPYILTKENNYEDNLERSKGTGISAAIAVDEEGLPVVVYKDAKTNSLRLARASDKNPYKPEYWKVQSVLSSSDNNANIVLDNITCAFDSKGKLHIAFKNKKNQLVYVESTGKTNNGGRYSFNRSVVIDNAANNTDIAMKDDIPYISYQDGENSYDAMKLAYKDSSVIGGWETMVAPSNEIITGERTCIETDANAADNNNYEAAIGFSPGSDYRVMFYVGK